jgi:hypothetical protein
MATVATFLNVIWQVCYLRYWKKINGHNRQLFLLITRKENSKRTGKGHFPTQ